MRWRLEELVVVVVEEEVKLGGGGGKRIWRWWWRSWSRRRTSVEAVVFADLRIFINMLLETRLPLFAA